MNTIASNFVGIKGGLLMSVIAFSIVFLVIVGLMIMMMALKKFTAAVEGARSTAADKAAAPAASAPAQTISSASTSAGAASEGDELVAVITAAIAAICGSGARIVSFRPTPPHTSTSPWSMTGRLQNSEGFAD